MNLGKEVREKALQMGIELPMQTEVLFEKHAALLEEWNQRFNLTRIPRKEMAEEAFCGLLDCLAGAAGKDGTEGSRCGYRSWVSRYSGEMCMPRYADDFGGFFGKTGEILQVVVDSLGLKNTLCLHTRAEEMGQNPEHREKYDAALARAVAGLPVLCEYLLPLVKVGGVAVAMKGPGGEEEVEEAGRALEILGGELTDVIELQLPSGDVRRLIVIGKGETDAGEVSPSSRGAAKAPLV